MSWMNRLSPPEPEYTDDEWDAAESALIEERADWGWSETEIAKAVDDFLIAEKCEQLREDLESVVADEELARRKESL